MIRHAQLSELSSAQIRQLIDYLEEWEETLSPELAAALATLRRVNEIRYLAAAKLEAGRL